MCVLVKNKKNISLFFFAFYAICQHFYNLTKFQVVGGGLGGVFCHFQHIFSKTKFQIRDDISVFIPHVFESIFIDG